MAVALRARDGETITVSGDRRVRDATAEADCADTLIRAAIAMGLNPYKAHRVFLRAARSQRTFYRRWDRLKDQPLRVAAFTGDSDD